MHILSILLFALFITPVTEALTFQNPLKPGKIRVKIADREMTLTRSTSCSKKRRGWPKAAACTCCLLKRGIRKREKYYALGGYNYVAYCKKKGYCDQENILAAMVQSLRSKYARRFLKVYSERTYDDEDYRKFLALLAQEHIITKRISKKRGWFSFLFKNRKRDRMGTPATYEEKAPPPYEEGWDSFVSDSEKGMFEMLYIDRDTGAFGKLFHPVTINGKEYQYVVIHTDQLRRLKDESKYFKAIKIESSRTGQAVDRVLNSLKTDGKVGDTGIAAGSYNTVLIRGFQN